MHPVEVKVRRNGHPFQVLEFFDFPSLPRDVSLVLDVDFHLMGDFFADRNRRRGKCFYNLVIELGSFEQLVKIGPAADRIGSFFGQIRVHRAGRLDDAAADAA